jgi:hypothetical protein
MTTATHAPRCQFADIGGLLAVRSLPRSPRDHGLAVSRALNPTNAAFKLLCRAGLATQTTVRSGSARLHAAGFPPLAMLKSP